MGTGIWEWKVLLTIAVHQDKIIEYSFLCKGETIDTDKYRVYYAHVTETKQALSKQFDRSLNYFFDKQVNNSLRFAIHVFLFINMATAKTTYSTEERVDIVKLYFENQGSLAETSRKFRTKYGRHSTLANETIKR